MKNEYEDYLRDNRGYKILWKNTNAYLFTSREDATKDRDNKMQQDKGGKKVETTNNFSFRWAE